MTKVFTGPLLSLRNLVSQETRRASVSKSKRLGRATVQYKDRTKIREPQPIRNPEAYAKEVALRKEHGIEHRTRTMPFRVVRRLYTNTKPKPVSLPKINLPDVPVED